MARSQKKEITRIRLGFPMFVIILVLFFAIGWKLYSLQNQVAAAEEERQRYEIEVAQQQAQNDALSADIEEGPTEEKMKEIARDELGYVEKGELVFQEK